VMGSKLPLYTNKLRQEAKKHLDERLESGKTPDLADLEAQFDVIIPDDDEYKWSTDVNEKTQFVIDLILFDIDKLPHRSPSDTFFTKMFPRFKLYPLLKEEDYKSYADVLGGFLNQLYTQQQWDFDDINSINYSPFRVVPIFPNMFFATGKDQVLVQNVLQGSQNDNILKLTREIQHPLVCIDLAKIAHPGLEIQNNEHVGKHVVNTSSETIPPGTNVCLYGGAVFPICCEENLFESTIEHIIHANRWQKGIFHQERSLVLGWWNEKHATLAHAIGSYAEHCCSPDSVNAVYYLKRYEFRGELLGHIPVIRTIKEIKSGEPVLVNYEYEMVLCHPYHPLKALAEMQGKPMRVKHFQNMYKDAEWVPAVDEGWIKCMCAPCRNLPFPGSFIWTLDQVNYKRLDELLKAYKDGSVKKLLTEKRRYLKFSNHSNTVLLSQGKKHEVLVLIPGFCGCHQFINEFKNFILDQPGQGANINMTFKIIPGPSVFHPSVQAGSAVAVASPSVVGSAKAIVGPPVVGSAKAIVGPPVVMAAIVVAAGPMPGSTASSMREVLRVSVKHRIDKKNKQPPVQVKLSAYEEKKAKDRQTIKSKALAEVNARADKERLIKEFWDMYGEDPGVQIPLDQAEKRRHIKPRKGKKKDNPSLRNKATAAVKLSPVSAAATTASSSAATTTTTMPASSSAATTMPASSSAAATTTTKQPVARNPLRAKLAERLAARSAQHVTHEKRDEETTQRVTRGKKFDFSGQDSGDEEERDEDWKNMGIEQEEEEEDLYLHLDELDELDN